MRVIIRTRRGLLLVTGVLGSLVMICFLLQQADVLLHPVAVEAAADMESGFLFPVQVPNTTLVIHDLMQYDSTLRKENCAAIILENIGTSYVEKASVYINWDGGIYSFDAEKMQPHTPIILLERNRQLYEVHSWDGCSGKQE